jgi:hypothetical protein
MSKLEEMVKDSPSSVRISNRHIVALCNLSTQVGVQGRSEIIGGQATASYSSVRIDLTADPEALVDCAQAGLAKMDRNYVTVSRIVQDTINEWLNIEAFS